MKAVFSGVVMNEVAAIVVTYNRKELLKECIEKLKCQTVPLDILVIDNASTDGTEKLFDKKNDGLYYFNTGSNLGGAGGFNYGIKTAYEMGYEYLWLMDDDTLPTETALEELLKAKNEIKEFGFLSSVALWKDNNLCNMNIPRTGISKKQINLNEKYNKIIMSTFVSFFISRKIVKEKGLPISDFIIWSDDLEYSRRISKDYPCYWICNSKVIHKMGSNEKVGIENEPKDRLWRYKLVYRNEVYVFKREGIKGWLYLFTRMILHSIRILKNSKENKMDKIIIIWKSFISGFSFNPKAEEV